MKILIIGNNLNNFLLLKHFKNSIQIIKDFDHRPLDMYDLIITNPANVDKISFCEKLIFNVIDNLNELNTTKNIVNLLIKYNYNYSRTQDDLIAQFIKNDKWNFYYKSCEKHNVKFIYDLFTECHKYNKIISKEIKFHKI